jgi:hypothetical protein
MILNSIVAVYQFNEFFSYEVYLLVDLEIFLPQIFCGGHTEREIDSAKSVQVLLHNLFTEL